MMYFNKRLVAFVLSFVFTITGFVLVDFDGANAVPQGSCGNWNAADGSLYGSRTIFNPNVSKNSGSSVRQNVVLDNDGHPCIAWSDDSSGNMEIYFTRWNGTQWLNAAGQPYPANPANVSQNTGTSDYVSLVLDGNNNPCVVWADNTPGNWEVYFARWNGTQWVNVSNQPYPANSGNVTQNFSNSQSPSLAISALGYPIIAWDDTAFGAGDICCVRWNGAQWVNMQGQPYPANSPNVSQNAGTSMYAYLKLDQSGRPCIVWNDGTFGSFEILFVRWDGTQWVNIQSQPYPANSANVSQTPSDSYNPYFDFDGSHNIWIVWQEYISGNWEICMVKQNGSQWLNVLDQPYPANSANISLTANHSTMPKIAFGADGNPCVVWSDRTAGNYEIVFIRWDGTQWVNLQSRPYPANPGEISEDVGYSVTPWMAIDPFGKIFITWSDGSIGNYEIYLVQSALSQWTDINGIPVLKSSQYAVNVSKNHSTSYNVDRGFELDNLDRPCIAWADDVDGQNNSYEIFFVRWDGTQWVNAAGQPYPANPANVTTGSAWSDNPSLAIDQNNNPCIAWLDYDMILWNYEVYFVRWDGTQWVNAAGQPYPVNPANVSQDGTESLYPSLALDSSGNPNIAWNDYDLGSGSWEVFFSRWNGTQWVNAAGQPCPANSANVSQTQGISSYPDLKLDSLQNPCIAWADLESGTTSDIEFVRWGSAGWVNVEGQAYPASSANVSQTAGESNEVSLALDSSDRPHLSWHEDISGNWEVIYTKWSGAGWVSVSGGTYSLATANISQNITTSCCPSLDLDQLENPCISWSDGSMNDGIYDIMLVRWDGVVWVDQEGSQYPAGSYNLNSNFGASSRPCMKIDSSGSPHIAWSDNTLGNFEILYARWANCLSVSKTAIKSDVFKDENVEFVVKITNPNTSRINNIQLVDTYPQELEFINSDPPMVAQSANSVSCTISVGPNETALIRLYFKIKQSAILAKDSVLEITNRLSASCPSFEKIIETQAQVRIRDIGLSVKKVAKKFQVLPGEEIEFAITVKNPSSTNLTNVKLEDIFPKEMKFLRSMPQMNARTSSASLFIGQMAPGSSRTCRVFFRINNSIRLSDGKMFLENLAKVTCNEFSPSEDRASFVVVDETSNENLSMSIKWQGINTKTSEGKTGEEIVAAVTPYGGSSPYTIEIDWGNGSKSKMFDVAKEGQAIFRNTYLEKGDFAVIVKCSDANGRDYIIERTTHIK